MVDRNQKALKEWASVVKALGEGKQILLLRKGGIQEKNRRFEMEESEFFLFPTFEHQEKVMLKPEFQVYIDQSQRQADHWAGKVELSYYAVVEEIFQVRELEPLLQLAPYHIWSEAFVRERFGWHPNEPLFIPLIRVCRLSSTLLIDSLERYGGCKSWVEFDRPIPTEKATPVLSDTEFQLQQERIRQILDKG
jgi:hypothetical protein